jgi:hypothetical protein
VTVISITRDSGSTLVNPPPTSLELGDKMRVFGHAEELDAFASHAAEARS